MTCRTRRRSHEHVVGAIDPHPRVDFSVPDPRPSSHPLGGIIHTYQAFDPKSFPSPTAPPPDLVSGAFEHMLAFGSTRQLTDEELARAIRLDPSQIKGLGPTIESLIATERACVWTLGGMLADAQFAQLVTEAQQAFAPFVGADGAVVFDMPARTVVIADALDPAVALVTMVPEGENREPDLYAARLEDNKSLPAEIPLQLAARKTWKPGTGIADPQVKVRSGRSVVLTFENDTTPRAILLEGHSARHLDTLDDGWKPWWQDTHLLHPNETARLAFIAEQPGRYAVDVIPLEGDGKAEKLWLELSP